MVTFFFSVEIIIIQKYLQVNVYKRWVRPFVRYRGLFKLFPKKSLFLPGIQTKWSAQDGRISI